MARGYIKKLLENAKVPRFPNAHHADLLAEFQSIAANESAVKAMGNAELKVIAAELVTQVRKSVTIDWTVRKSARAKIKVMVKRILKKHGYPPDL